MPNFTTVNSLGDSIESSEITDGNITYVKLGSDLEKYELLDTLTFASDRTKTSETLPAYNNYKLVFSLQGENNQDNLQMCINGNTGAIYDSKFISNITTRSAINGTSCRIGTLMSSHKTEGNLQISGVSSPKANGKLSVTGTTCNSYITDNFICGSCAIGNAVQLENITIKGTSYDLTGKVKIYGFD